MCTGGRKQALIGGEYMLQQAPIGGKMHEKITSTSLLFQDAVAWRRAHREGGAALDCNSSNDSLSLRCIRLCRHWWICSWEQMVQLYLFCLCLVSYIWCEIVLPGVVTCNGFEDYFVEQLSANWSVLCLVSFDSESENCADYRTTQIRLFFLSSSFFLPPPLFFFWWSDTSSIPLLRSSLRLKRGTEFTFDWCF